MRLYKAGIDMSLTVNGHSIATDKEGYLKQRQDWSMDVAVVIALAEGITLTDEHRELIKLIRQFYQDYDFTPAMRALVKYTAAQLGKDKGNSIYIMRLFSGNSTKILSKIAGLPRPINCLP